MAQQSDGNRTFTAAAALAQFQLVKLSAASGDTVEETGVGDVAIGTVQEAVAAGEDVTIRLFDSGRTSKAIAGGAITEGATVFAGANGRLTTADPLGNNIGRFIAMEAASGNGSIIEIIPTTDSGMAGAGAVASVFGRTGAIVAVASDYDASQVDNDSGVTGATVKDALDTLDAVTAPVSSVFARTGAVAAAASDYDASQVDNDSTVAGSKVSDALNTLNAGLGQITLEANTDVAASPNVITAAESGKNFTNEGATAENHHDLPAAAVGLVYSFIVQDIDGIQVNAAAGDTIRIAGAVSASGGFMESATVGSVITIFAINATEWFTFHDTAGAWSVT